MFSFTSFTKKLSMTLILSAAFTIAASAGEVTVGSVNASALNMRSESSTSASIVASAPKGEMVFILETSGSWCKVNYQYEVGYMSAEYLTISQAADFSSSPLTGVITGSVVNLRSEPNISSAVSCQLRKDTVTLIVGVENGWYKIKYNSYSGYIHPDYLQIQKQPSTSAFASSSVTDSTSSSAVAASSDNTSSTDAATTTDLTLRNQVVEYAKQYIGTKYTSGGRSPSVGFDCSGFIYYVFKNFGYTLNPGASTQMDLVDAIAKEDLLPGDLVFFNSGTARRASHVGIYIGDNQFIHAVSYGKPLAITSLGASYYANRYVGSGRVLP